MYDIVLIKPTTVNMINPFGGLNLSLLLLGSWLESKGGFKVSVIHLEEFDNDLTCIPEANYYGLTGVSTQINEMKSIYGFLKQRNPTSIIIGGGAQVSSLPYWSLENNLCDVVVRGYGEYPLLDILTTGTFGDNIITKDKDFYSKDLDQFRDKTAFNSLDGGSYKDVKINFNLIKYWLYQSFNIITSMGCKYRCKYCYKMHPTNTVINYDKSFVYGFINEVYSVQGNSKHVFILDEDIAQGFEDKIPYFEYLSSFGINFICQARPDTLKPEYADILKNNGCTEVRLGIETSSRELLHSLGKDYDYTKTIEYCDYIYKLGIDIRAFAMFGLEHETLQDVETTVNLIERIHAKEVRTSTLSFFPGTYFWYTLSEDERESILSQPELLYTAGIGGRGGIKHENTEYAIKLLKDKCLYKHLK